MYLFCTVAPHCDWLSYQRDQLRISQSTNTWIKEFLSQTPESRSFFRRQITGEMPRISRCACGVPCSLPPWRPSMKPLIAPPAPFDETIDRGSGPTCSLCPRWRPSMKPLIVPPVLFDETIDRDSGPTPLIYYYMYLLSFAEADSCCCCMYISCNSRNLIVGNN